MNHSNNFIKLHSPVNKSPQYINYMTIIRMFPTMYEKEKATIITFLGGDETIVKESIDEIFKLMDKPKFSTTINYDKQDQPLNFTIDAKNGSISCINSKDDDLV